MNRDQYLAKVLWLRGAANDACVTQCQPGKESGEGERPVGSPIVPLRPAGRVLAPSAAAVPPDVRV